MRRKGVRKSEIRKTVENLDDLFQTFLLIKKAEGRAESTMQQYRDNYGYFIDYLDTLGIVHDLEEIDRHVIRNYIMYMQDEIVKFDGHRFKTEAQKTTGLKPATINTRLKTLRVMFKCLYEEELIENDPTKGVHNVREPEEEIIVLTSDELKRLFKVPNKRLYAEFRDYVLMNLSLSCMARISEMINLTVEDFDFTNKTVTIPAIIAKNRKARTIPIDQRTTRLIKELITENKRDFDTDYIFLTVYGERISRNHFRKRLNEYAQKAKIKKNIHPHLFRHTAATLALENGMSMRHLQLILGHKDLRVIQRYTHISDKSLRKQHDEFSPMNQVIEKLNLPRKIKRN